MSDVETCTRCSEKARVESERFVDAEVIDGEFVCGGCVTGEEQQAIDEQAMADADHVTLMRLDPDHAHEFDE